MNITAETRGKALGKGVVRHIVVTLCLFYLSLFWSPTMVCATFDWYELNNTCYGLATSTTTTLNFTDANSSCIANNAVLTSVPDLDVHTFITQYMVNGTDYWVNLQLDTSTNEYLWPNGDSPVNSTWFSGEPNFSGDRVRYTRVIGSSVIPDHRLGDLYATFKKAYSCQRSAVNTGDVGTGQEVTSIEASHYVTMDTISTKSRLRCTAICLQTFGCGLIGHLHSTSQCLLLRWSVSIETLQVDPAFRFYTIQRKCNVP